MKARRQKHITFNVVVVPYGSDWVHSARTKIRTVTDFI